MRAVGIIAEFDPFHDGHAFLIREAKKLTGAEYVVVAMSGDFVERGEPAVFDKFERARAAVLGGADAVFELPTVYATSGAKIFSEAGVRLLCATGCTDTVCFGSECGDIDILSRASELLNNESEEFKNALSKYQKAGDSYPKAREKALIELGVSGELVRAAREPNNILGIHYISAIKSFCGDMKAVTVKRTDEGYHESASQIRDEIFNHGLTKYGSFPIRTDDFSQILFARLMSMTAGELTEIADVNDTLARSVMKHREKSMTFSELVSKVKSKNNLYTSVSRALLHVVLDMKEKIRPAAGEIRIPYLRLLAFNEKSSGLLRYISDNSKCPLITKPADAPCRDDEIFRLDIRAAALYGGAVLAGYGVKLPEDMTRGPVICR